MTDRFTQTTQDSALGTRHSTLAIDMRVRPPSGNWLGTHLYANVQRIAGIIRGFGLEPDRSYLESSMALLMDELEVANVRYAVVAGRSARPPWNTVPNDEIAAIVKSAPGRLLGFGSVDAADGADAVAEVDRAVKELGFRGIAVDPGFARDPVYADHQRWHPIYQRCMELDVPVMITASHQAGPDMTWGDPAPISRVAGTFPKLKIVVAHGSWPYVMGALGAAHRYENLYLLPDFYLVNMPGARDYVQAANTFLADRLVYGSGYPVGPLVGTVDAYRQAGFRDDVLPKVLYENAAKLLKLDS